MPEYDDTVKKIIQKSGNSFHFKVLRHLEELGWQTTISPYYTDNLTNKPREIDLIAEKAFPIKNFCQEFLGNINVQLFIECKYIPQKTVFWFHDKNISETQTLIVRTTGLDQYDCDIQKHHYLNGKNRAAKLFADEGSKAAENETFYKAINQSLNALIYYRDKGSIIRIEHGRISYTKRTLTFPVIVCDSFEKLYGLDVQRGEEPFQIDDGFHLEVNYAYVDEKTNSHNEYFLIDVVSLELLDSFLKTVEDDVNLTGKTLDHFFTSRHAQ